MIGAAGRPVQHGTQRLPEGPTLLHWLHEYQRDIEHVCKRVELEQKRGDLLHQQNEVLRSQLGLPRHAEVHAARWPSPIEDRRTYETVANVGLMDEEVKRLQRRVEELEAAARRQFPRDCSSDILISVGSEVTVTSDQRVLEQAVRAAGDPSCLPWPNTLENHPRSHLGMSGEVVQVSISPAAVRIRGGIGWIPIRALVGYESFESRRNIVGERSMDILTQEQIVSPRTAAVLPDTTAETECRRLREALARQTAEADREHQLRCQAEHKLAVLKQDRKKLEQTVDSLHSKLMELEMRTATPGTPGSLPVSPRELANDDSMEVEEAWPPGAAEKPVHLMRKADLVHELALDDEYKTSRAALEKTSIDRLRMLVRDSRGKRQKVLLARQLFTATFEGLFAENGPACELAIFRVTESQRYEKPGPKGFIAYMPGSEFVIEVGKQDDKIQAQIRALVSGIAVRIVFQHDRVEKDGEQYEEHLVTYLAAAHKEARVLLARQTFSATFAGTRTHVREGGHTVTLALFRVQESQRYENPGQFGFKAQEPGAEFRLCIEDANPEVQAKIKRLTNGVIAKITYQQEYVDSPVTHSGHVEQAVTAFDVVGGDGRDAGGAELVQHGERSRADHFSSGSAVSRRARPIVRDTRPVEKLKKAELVNAVAEETDKPRAALEKCTEERLRILLRELRKGHDQDMRSQHMSEKSDADAKPSKSNQDGPVHNGLEMRD